MHPQCLCLYGGGAEAESGRAGGSQKVSYESWFSPTVWVLGTELRLLGLAAGALTS